MLALALALSGLLAPAASAVVVHGPNGQLLGVTPLQSVAPTRLPGALVPHASSARAIDAMSWHMGPVLRSSSAYLVYWDPSSNPTLAGWKPLLEQYLSDVAADSSLSSNLFSVGRQYWDGSGYAGAEQSFSSSQVLNDTQPYPTPATNCPAPTGGRCITDAEVQQELVRLLATDPSLPDDGPTSATALPQNAPVRFAVLPPNVNECFSGAQCASNNFCSYHSAYSNGGRQVIYDLIPSFVLQGNAKACQDDGNNAVQQPNGNPADVMLKYLAHEYIETITDPLLNAWWSSSTGNEVADDCNVYGAQSDPASGASPHSFTPTLGGSAASGTLFNQVVNGHDYYLQSTWSNGADDCAMDALGGTVSPEFSAPAGTLVAGNPISFDPSASSSTQPYSSVTWDWGDGSGRTFSHGTAPPNTVKHTYAAGGAYTVTLTLVDSLGDQAAVSHEITVHSPPVAAFTFSPAAPYAGDPVQFDASSSSDPDPGVTLTGYQWDFGDGTPTDSGATPAPHTYANPGTYTVTLTVTNSEGLTNSVQHQIAVVAEAPQASFTIDPATGASPNQPVTFDATATDPHANITGYSWDFGDGTPTTVDTTASGTDTISHSYAASGTYTVTLTVSAENNTSTTVTRELTVGPVAAFSYSPSQPQNGTQVTFDGTGSSDPEPGMTITSYNWDFGDGTPPVSAGVATHQYAHPGTYTVTLTVGNGTGSDSTSQSVAVSDAPPTAAFSLTTPSPGRVSRRASTPPPRRPATPSAPSSPLTPGPSATAPPPPAPPPTTPTSRPAPTRWA